MTRRIFILAVVFCLLGFHRSYAAELANFDGNADFISKRVSFRLVFQDNSSIIAEVAPQSPTSFLLQGKIDHVKALIFDISSQVQSAIELINDQNSVKSFLRGTIESKYSLVNFKPVREFRGNFEVRDGRLYLKSFLVGSLVFDGYVGFLPPFDIALTIQLNEIDSEELSVISTISGCPESSQISGAVSGRITLSGFWDRLMIRGRIASFNGAVRDLAYEQIIANFEGLYPNIQITDTMVTEESGLSFSIEGMMDLRNHCNLLGGLTTLKMSPLIDESSLRREWTIKRQQDTKSSATELKYRLQKKELDIPAQEDSDMFSIERSIKF